MAIYQACQFILYHNVVLSVNIGSFNRSWALVSLVCGLDSVWPEKEEKGPCWSLCCVSQRARYFRFLPDMAKGFGGV